MNGHRLHRPLTARLFGTASQAVLSVVAAVTVGLVVTVVVALTLGKSTNGLTWLFVVPVLLTLLWSRGLTAWAGFDDEGVHTRYFVAHDYPWAAMRSITLQRLDNVASAQAKGAPAIVVRMKDGSDDRLSAALRCGRRRREFGSALLASARAHGVRAVVGSSGWDEPPDEHVEPYIG